MKKKLRGKELFVNTGFDEFLEENVKTRIAEMPWMNERTFAYAKSMEEVEEYIDQAIEAKRCVVDLETTGLNTRVEIIDGVKVPVGKIVGFALCFDSIFGFYIPINHREGSELNLPKDLVFKEIKRLCLNCITIYHNAKFDLSYMKNYGIVLDSHHQFEDTLILAYLHDSGRKNNQLKVLSEELIDQKMLKFNEVAREGHFDLVNPNVGYKYAASDAICTMDLYNFFLEQDIVRCQEMIYNIEKRVVFVVMDMEANLIKINVPYLEDLKEKVEIRLKDIEQEIYDLVGHKFNMGSPQQLGKILFEDLKYKYPDKDQTKSGQYSTSEKTLSKIAELYPIVKKIINFRGLEKVLGTYINNLLNNHDKEGYVKLSFKQTGTDTGRFSSPGGFGIDIDGGCGVNIQSTPKMPGEDNPDIDMRKAFEAREGKTIVAIDYANEEMRVATNISQEDRWIKSIQDGIDFHTATGAIISGKDPKDVTKAERKIGKTVNFLALYLGGPYTLAAGAKVTIPEAKRILKTFFRGVPKLKKWIDRVIVIARKEKYVKTIFGRIRPLKKYYESGDKGHAAHADRCAVNSKIQGTSADIMKIMMSKLNTWLTVNDLHDDIKVLITMHDELVFEMPTDKLKLYVPEICKIMELRDVIKGKLKWVIPLEVDVQYGSTWRVENDFFEDYPELRKRLDEPLMAFSPLQKEKYENEKDGKNVSPVEKVKSEEINSDKSPQEISEKNLEGEKKVSETPDIEEVPQDAVSDEQTTVKKNEKNIENDKEITKKEGVNRSKINDLYLIFTLKELSTITSRWLNDILLFLIDETNQYDDKDKKILKVRDREGNSLLVSEYKIHPESFLLLARFFGI